MSTEMSTVATAATIAAASNEELWTLLMDVTNVKEDSIQMISKTMWDAGLKGPADLDILSNLPKVVRSIAEGLKAIPSKKFLSEMKSRSVTSKLPFCPICRDAGLSADEYTSHHIWSDESRETVVCPTLLAHQCEKCGQLGHMPSYCGKVVATTKRTEPQQQQQQQPPIIQEKTKHCKVCFQAGFSVEVYSSHFTKVDGEILCPTILNNPCLRCGKKGHTPKYCSVTVRSDKLERRPVIQTQSATYRPSTKQLSKQEIANKYGDDRFEHDEHGKPVAMKQFTPIGREDDLRGPQRMGRYQSQRLLEDVMDLLEQARRSGSPDECARLVQEAMDMQSFLLTNLGTV